MQASWWRERKDLDEHQEKIIVLQKDGNHLLVGPPGCGKTNLLLLRAKYLSGSGLKNVLFLTFGRTLAEFIKTGIGPKKLIDPDLVMTYRKWSLKMIGELAPARLKEEPEGTYEDTRDWYSMVLTEVIKGLPSDYFDAIFVDEVQDLTEAELSILSRITQRLNVAGDVRQCIYAGQGIESAHALSFQESALEYHYRIGLAICNAADKALPPQNGVKPLAQTSQAVGANQPLSRKEKPIDCGSSSM